MIGSQSLRKDIRVANEGFAIHLAHSGIMIWSPPQDRPRFQSGVYYLRGSAGAGFGSGLTTWRSKF